MAFSLLGGVTVTDYSGTAGGTVSVNAGSGTNRVLVAFAFERTGVGSAPTTINVLTYNGVSFLTNVVPSTRDASRDYRVSCFWYIGPASGINDVVITWASSIITGGLITAVFSADNTISKVADGADNGSSTTPASTLIPTGNNQLAVGGAVSEDNGPMSVGADETLINHIDATAWCAAASYDLDFSSSQSINFSTATATDWAAVSVAFAETAGAAASLVPIQPLANMIPNLVR